MQTTLELEGSCVFAEVVADALRSRLHTLIAVLPTCRTNFAVGLMKAERVDYPEHFIYVATKREIVNRLALNDAFLVDEERTAHGNARFRMFDAVCLSDLMLDVRHHWELSGTNASLVDVRVAPGRMGKMRVNGHSNKFNALFGKGCETLVVSNDLSWANECEIKRPEKQYDFLASQVRELERLVDGTVRHNRCGCEIWGFLCY